MSEKNRVNMDPAAAEAAEHKGEKNQVEEITIKFGKGLVGEPFMSKNGTELVRISIPNSDPKDHSPWQEFVLASKQVHENQYGKGMWAKLPAEGHTTVSKPFLAGQDENGRNIWKKEMRSVPNRELKEMVEFYKNRNREDRASAPEGREASPKGPVSGEEADVPEWHPAGEKGPPGRQEKWSVKAQLEAGKKKAAKNRAVRDTTVKKHVEQER